MEAILLFVTGIAIVVALAAAFTIWRMLDREDARRRARVSALAAAIRPTPEPSAVDVVEPGEAREAGNPGAVAVHAPAAGTAAVWRESMFAATDTVSLRTSRARTALAFAGSAGAVLVAALLTGGATGARTANPPTAPAPLELLALHHEQGTDALTVSGTVRNPAAAAPVRDITAVVFLFDQAGGFLGSSRARVDFTIIAPGKDSPFTVTLKSTPPAAARYRVSFRHGDRELLPHVDRREKI